MNCFTLWNNYLVIEAIGPGKEVPKLDSQSLDVLPDLGVGIGVQDRVAVRERGPELVHDRQELGRLVQEFVRGNCDESEGKNGFFFYLKKISLLKRKLFLLFYS